MIVIRKLKQIYSSCQKYKNAGKRIGFVATMGTLHPGQPGRQAQRGVPHPASDVSWGLC